VTYAHRNPKYRRMNCTAALNTVESIDSLEAISNIMTDFTLYGARVIGERYQF
jgi:hypothetical protein